MSYLPVLPGDYSILVKYNDKHIAGSPFSARITGTGSSVLCPNKTSLSLLFKYHQVSSVSQEMTP